MLTTSRRAWCAMSAGGSACGVVSSFGRRTCCACVSARRNRTGKDAGAGKTTTASEKPCTALIVVSGAAVQRCPVLEKPGRATACRCTLINRMQQRGGLCSYLSEAAFKPLPVPMTSGACRLCGCASVAGGWGDDHHTAAARVQASTARGLWRRACRRARNSKGGVWRDHPLTGCYPCCSVWLICCA